MEPATVAVFGASGTRPGDREWSDAVRCGRLLAERGFVVATGGYGGTMEAVSEGAAGAGGWVIGHSAPSVFPQRPGVNPHVADERPAGSLTERIHQLVGLSAGAIALPGSLGTLTELLVAWNVAYVLEANGGAPSPVVAVGPAWRDIIDHLTGVLDVGGGLVSCVDTVDEAVDAVAARLSAP